jgi:predicted ATPase
MNSIMPKIYVLTGGPGTGKTTILNELAKKGFKTFPEAARTISETDDRFKGQSSQGTDVKEFQKAIFELQKEQIGSCDNETIIVDRSFGDSIAYYKIRGIEIPKEFLEYAKKVKYQKIFLCDPLPNYETDTLRQESIEEQKFAHELIIKTYKDLGYNPIIVPFMSVEDRVNFILSKVN